MTSLINDFLHVFIIMLICIGYSVSYLKCIELDNIPNEIKYYPGENIRLYVDFHQTKFVDILLVWNEIEPVVYTSCTVRWR